MSETSPKKNTRKNEKVKSMFQIVASQFLEHKFAVSGFIVIMFFVLLALCAPVISHLLGQNHYDQDVFNRYKPIGSEISYSSDRQEQALVSFVEKSLIRSEKIYLALKENFPTTFEFEENTSDQNQEEKAESLEEFIISTHEIISDDPKLVKSLEGLSHPEVTEFLSLRNSFKSYHILGTDELGRDVFMRLIYGARVSMGIGIMVAFAAAIIGLIIGSIAGFYGGILDTVLMRVTDSLLSLPLLPFLIVFAAMDLNKIPFLSFLVGSENESIFKLVIVLCLFSWMTVARLVRGAILSLKQQEFIHAAKTLGAKDRTIIFTHIVPNVVAPLLVAVTLNIGQSILTEAALSFLGLGVQPPTPSWGNMLFNAQEIIWEAPSLAILPGLMIFIVVISFNFLGDGLQDAIDPKAIRR